MVRQINIGYHDKVLHYGVSIDQSTDMSKHILSGIRWYRYGDTIYILYPEDDCLIRDVNEWIVCKASNTSHIPTTTNSCHVSLHLPEWSLAIYERNVKYILTLSVFINGVRVVICSKLLRHTDSIASSPFIYKSVSYLEELYTDIINPYDILYSDDWSSFRSQVCHPGDTSVLDDINSDGSMICTELSPVTLNNDDEYRVMSECIEGLTYIPLESVDSTSLRVSCSPQLSSTPGISVNISFNDVYGEDIITYFSEVYHEHIEEDTLRYELVVKDNDSIYKYIYRDAPIISNPQYTSHTFSKSELGFQDWSSFKTGLFLVGSISIIRDGNTIFSSISNELPLTNEIYKYLISTDVDYINLNYVHMQNYQVDVVNKIEKKVFSISKPDEYKSNILKPVFIHSYTTHDLIIHPAVTENISIELGAYSSSVKTFYLSIEGVEFVEYGRSSTGVVFRITGSTLPNKRDRGLFYILNEDRELVTTGNYTYAQ